jgi:hypothetical protein
MAADGEASSLPWPGNDVHVDPLCLLVVLDHWTYDWFSLGDTWVGLSLVVMGLSMGGWFLRFLDHLTT